MSQTVRILVCSAFVASAIFPGGARELLATARNGPSHRASEVPSKLDRALNDLLPRPELYRKRFVITLRFLPSFHPEAQIVLSYDVNSKGAVEYRSLEKRLAEVVPSDEGTAQAFIVPGPEELTRLTGLKEVDLSVSPEQMKEWLKGLLDSLATSSPTQYPRTLEGDGTQEIVVQLDGTAYTVDLETARDRLSLRFSGSEIDTGGPRDDVPVVKWMNSVREQVMKMAKR